MGELLKNKPPSSAAAAARLFLLSLTAPIDGEAKEPPSATASSLCPSHSRFLHIEILCVCGLTDQSDSQSGFKFLFDGRPLDQHRRSFENAKSHKEVQ